MTICPSCGQTTEQDDRFCYSCGAPLTEPVEKGRWWPPVLAMVLIFAIGLGGFFLLRHQPVITTDASMPWFTVRDGALYFDQSCYTGSSTLTVPASIGGQSVTAIADNCFALCSELVTVELPEGITSIGTNAFHGCENLRGLRLPETVTTIGDYAFAQCSSLEAICIPVALNQYGSYLFYNCTSLRYLFYSGTLSQWKALQFTEFATGSILSCTDGFFQLN